MVNVGNIAKEIFSNLRGIITTIIVIGGVLLIYLNYKKILAWFQQKSNEIKTGENPTPQNLNDPTYVINKKIIKNYVDEIIDCIGKVGTDEKRLDNVYKNLKNTSVENTIAVWNEYNSRNLYYNDYFGTYQDTQYTGGKLNLYQVLKQELDDNQSEKNAWVNWDWLLRKRAGLV